MTRHLTNDELRQFRARSLDSQRLLQADRHLAGCAECRLGLRQVGSVPVVPELAPSADAPLHPSYEELCAFMDSAEAPVTEEREWIELHVKACSDCAAELRDLQGFDTRLAEEAVAAKTPVAVSPVVHPKGLFGRVQDWLRAPESSPYGNARFAFSSAALLAVGIGLMAQVQLSHTGDLASQVGGSATTAAPTNEFEFYAGLAVLVVSLAAIVYRSRK